MILSNLTADTLDTLREYLPKMLDANKKLVKLFREENTLEAFRLFPTFIEGLDWLVQAVVLINKNELLFKLNIETVNSFLNEINDGISSGNFVAIADILEYEISPLLEKILVHARG